MDDFPGSARADTPSKRKARRAAVLLSGFVLFSATVWGQTPSSSPNDAAMQTGILLIRGDRAASLSIDGKGAGDLAAGGFLQVSAVAGEHFVEARDKDRGCKWEKKVTIPPGMQVAELVDFGATCAATPGAEASVPSPANIAPPSVIAPQDREANELRERGCRLMALDRASEAVPLLERAASLLPDLDASCLKEAQIRLKDAQHKLSECENPPAPIAPGKKQKKAKVKQPDCMTESIGMRLGNYREGFLSVDSLIQGLEASGINAGSAYEFRALYQYALGNPIPALRDLQNTLDSYRRAPGASEAGTYFYRAIILADMGNTEAARQDCMTALTYKYFGYMPFEKEFCTRLTTSPDTLDGGQAGNGVNAPEDNHRVDEAIGRIRAGRYAPMPAAQASARSGLGSPRLTIENGTQYELRVYLSGPAARSVSIQAGASAVLDLAAGSFKLAAEIPNSSILPFYGEQTFNNGTAYVERFYVQRVQ